MIIHEANEIPNAPSWKRQHHATLYSIRVHDKTYSTGIPQCTETCILPRKWSTLNTNTVLNHHQTTNKYIKILLFTKHQWELVSEFSLRLRLQPNSSCFCGFMTFCGKQDCRCKLLVLVARSPGYSNSAPTKGQTGQWVWKILKLCRRQIQDKPF